MSGEYEFRYQTIKQKVVLYTTKGVALVLMSFNIYILALNDNSLYGQINSAAGVFMSFWIYANLLQVKVELQELFIPPFNLLNGVEFLLIAIGLYLISYFV